MPSKVQLIGGLFQDSEGNALANGYLKFKLSQDGAVAGVGSICAGVEITLTLNSSGSVDVSTPQYLWGNDQILPVNTFYRVTGYTAKGQPAWGPNNQQVIGNGGTFDVGTWVPNQVFSWTPPLSTVLMKTNGVVNAVQTVLDLTAGSNVTISNVGGVTTVSSTGGSSTNIPLNTQAGTGYTLVLADAGRCVEMTNASANTVTVPPDASVAFPVGTVLTIRQEGAGQTQVVAGAGVTIHTPETLFVRSQYGWVTLHKRAANDWCLEGNLQVTP
jgi:hypothetical protein